MINYKSFNIKLYNCVSVISAVMFTFRDIDIALYSIYNVKSEQYLYKKTSNNEKQLYNSFSLLCIYRLNYRVLVVDYP